MLRFTLFFGDFFEHEDSEREASHLSEEAWTQSPKGPKNSDASRKQCRSEGPFQEFPPTDLLPPRLPGRSEAVYTISSNESRSVEKTAGASF